MGWWGDRVLPRMTDRVLGDEAIAKVRAEVCAGLRGEVVEIGFGSGLNAPHYPASVTSVTAIEPSDLAWEIAQPRITETRADVRRGGLDGQRLDLADESVDSALSTFTMCTVPDLDLVLREVTRVLRPGGRLHFLEHGRADEPRVARWQRRVRPLNRRLMGGCVIDRQIDAYLERSRLSLEHLETGYGEGPKVAAFRYLGTAVKPAAPA